MQRRLTALVSLVALASAATAATLTAPQKQASARYLDTLRNTDGGYRASSAPAASQASNLTAIFRGYHYLGDETVDRKAPARFLETCWNNVDGAYSDIPGGSVDVRSAAMGMMARVELKVPHDERMEQDARFLERNAETAADIYFAGAAFDAAHHRTTRTEAWLDLLDRTRHPEGTYGKSAFDTATAVITRLRLGARINDREAVVRSLKTAQNPDGGFSVTGETSDLPTTYRVMRAFHMLHEKPDLAKLRAFVASCRNSDGGSGPTKGAPSTGPTTYNAAIVLTWADELGH